MKIGDKVISIYAEDSNEIIGTILVVYKDRGTQDFYKIMWEDGVVDDLVPREAVIPY